MILDFKELKESKSLEIVRKLDHSLLVNANDKELMKVAPLISENIVIIPYETTAENLAFYLFHIINIGLANEFKDVFLKKVIVHETEKGCAIYEI